MTDREKAIVMAHTGICMLTGDKFTIFHKYVDELMGRPVFSHEIGLLADTIKEKSKADFIALCKENDLGVDAVSREKVWYMITGGKYSDEDDKKFIDRLVNKLAELPSVTPTCKKGKWLGDKRYPICPKCNCNIIEEYISCSDYAEMYKPMKFCPNCGADMREVKE